MKNEWEDKRVLVRKSERPLGRRRRGWKSNIKMELQDVGCRDMNWMELAQSRDG